jgi:hypothetical protein
VKARAPGAGYAGVDLKAGDGSDQFDACEATDRRPEEGPRQLAGE